MRLKLTLLFIISITFLNAQLSQKEFDKMLVETKELISKLKNANYKKLENILGIPSEEIRNQTGRVLEDSLIDFNGLNQHSYIFPFYRETELDSSLELTIIASEIQERKKGEKYSRAKYYIVLKTGIEFNREKEKVAFTNAGLISGESNIHKWWLGQFDNYMVETKKIMEKFGYKMPPPPPPPPPLNLK